MQHILYNFTYCTATWVIVIKHFEREWKIRKIEWLWCMINNEIGGIRNNSTHKPQFKQCCELIAYHRHKYKHFPKTTLIRFVCVSLQISKNIKPYSLFLNENSNVVREYCYGRNVESMVQRMLRWSKIKVAWPLDIPLFWMYKRINFNLGK